MFIMADVFRGKLESCAESQVGSQRLCAISEWMRVVLGHAEQSKGWEDRPIIWMIHANAPFCHVSWNMQSASAH